MRMNKKQKLCLSIDTASDLTSVALVDDMGQKAVAELTVARGQGEALFSMISQLFDEMHKTPSDLTHIGVAVGPGSFTGVRIGLATARGLGLALGIPVLGVNNFQAVAGTAQGSGKIVLDSKRQDYFVQDFQKGHLVGVPALKTTDELKQELPFTAIGNGAKKLADTIGCDVMTSSEPTAITIAQIVLHRPQDTVEPHPQYLREADVTI